MVSTAYLQTRWLWSKYRQSSTSVEMVINVVGVTESIEIAENSSSSRGYIIVSRLRGVGIA